MMIKKPKNTNPNLYYTPFISLAKGDDLIESLTISKKEIVDLINQINDAISNYKYDENKWTIKQVLKHISDSERVHAYRALRFSKNDKTDLPGFNENDYAECDDLENISMDQIKADFISVRNSTIQLFKSLTKEALDYKGTGNKLELTARIVGWIISGHSIHHCNIIKERYLKNNN